MEQRFEHLTLTPQPVVSTRTTGSLARIGETLIALLQSSQDAIEAAGVPAEEAPFARFHSQDGDTVDVEAGFFVSGPVEIQASDAAYAQLPGGAAVVVIHRGPYDDLPTTHARLHVYLCEESLRARGPAWELFVDDPEVIDPAEVRTRVVQPVEPVEPGP